MMDKALRFIEDWWMVPFIIFVVIQLFITMPQVFMILAGLFGFFFLIAAIVATIFTIKVIYMLATDESLKSEKKK